MKLIYTLLCLTFYSSILFSQDINRDIRTEDGRQFLIGKINLEGLKSSPYQTWYTTNHEAYGVDMEKVADIKNDLAKYNILLFMGTWCGDSKREVPRFIKILEKADFPMQNLKMVALDRRKEHYKKSPTGEEWGLQIKRVPTFIFLKNGKEVNRIVESPINSLEEDIQAIILQESYTPNYADLMKGE